MENKLYPNANATWLRNNFQRFNLQTWYNLVCRKVIIEKLFIIIKKDYIDRAI